MKSLKPFTFTLTIMFASGMIGCAARSHSASAEARLYNLSSGEIIVAHFDSHPNGKGTINFSFPSGEVLKGEYITLHNKEVTWGSVYGTVYGGGTVGSVSGSGTSVRRGATEYGSAIVTGDKGTVLQCEYLSSSSRVSGTGACRDNHGNLYKLMF
jgi:hypothetical protein